MCLDATVPAYAFETLETEMLWDLCREKYGNRAPDEWGRFKAQNERSGTDALPSRSECSTGQGKGVADGIQA